MRDTITINIINMNKLLIKISLIILLFFVFTLFSYADDYSPPMVHQIYFTYDGEPYEKEVKYSIDCYDSHSVELDEKDYIGPPRTFYVSASCPSFGCRAHLGHNKLLMRSSINYCNVIGSSEDGYFLIENISPSFLLCGSGNGIVKSFLSDRKYFSTDLLYECRDKFQIDKCLNKLEIINPDDYENEGDYYYEQVNMCNVFFNIPYNSFTEEKPEPSIIIDEPHDFDKVSEPAEEEVDESSDDEEVTEAPKAPEPENKKTNIVSSQQNMTYNPYSNYNKEAENKINTIFQTLINKNIIIYISLAVIIVLLMFNLLKRK